MSDRQALLDEIVLCETHIEFLTAQANAYRETLEEVKAELASLDAKLECPPQK
jgi:hypothetical protein